MVAPYATAQRIDAPSDGLGLAARERRRRVGVRRSTSSGARSPAPRSTPRSTPTSRRSSPTSAQIGANERFALFYPEKRSFFLEGVDLFATPFQAVYTRTITAPSGGRARDRPRRHHRRSPRSVARDRGDGSVILPGAAGLGLRARRTSARTSASCALRHDLGQSFVSVLATGRAIDGGGHNRSSGPTSSGAASPPTRSPAQALWSDSRTPNRPDLADGVGRPRASRTARCSLTGRTTRARSTCSCRARTSGRRSAPTTASSRRSATARATSSPATRVRPKDAFFSRIRAVHGRLVRRQDHDGSVLARRVSVGAGMDGRWNSFIRIELNRDDIPVGDALFTRFRPYVTVQTSPGRVLNNISLRGLPRRRDRLRQRARGHRHHADRQRHRAPDDHLELTGNAARALAARRRSGARRRAGCSSRRSSALRASWSFNSRAFVRLIGQYVADHARPVALHVPGRLARTPRSASPRCSATSSTGRPCVYVGYGDDRELAAAHRPARAQRAAGVREGVLRAAAVTQRARPHVSA